MIHWRLSYRSVDHSYLLSFCSTQLHLCFELIECPMQPAGASLLLVLMLHHNVPHLLWMVIVVVGTPSDIVWTHLSNCSSSLTIRNSRHRLRATQRVNTLRLYIHNLKAPKNFYDWCFDVLKTLVCLLSFTW